MLACGRRWGKTTFGEDRLIGPALDGSPVAYFAPTYGMVTEVWREYTRILRPVTARTNASEHRLELITGGVLDMWSLDSPDAARGRKYARVVIDEAAMIPDLLNTFHLVIRPTLEKLSRSLMRACMRFAPSTANAMYCRPRSSSSSP